MSTSQEQVPADVKETDVKPAAVIVEHTMLDKIKLSSALRVHLSRASYKNGKVYWYITLITDGWSGGFTSDTELSLLVPLTGSAFLVLGKFNSLVRAEPDTFRIYPATKEYVSEFRASRDRIYNVDDTKSNPAIGESVNDYDGSVIDEADYDPDTVVVKNTILDKVKLCPGTILRLSKALCKNGTIFYMLWMRMDDATYGSSAVHEHNFLSPLSDSACIAIGRVNTLITRNDDGIRLHSLTEKGCIETCRTRRDRAYDVADSTTDPAIGASLPSLCCGYVSHAGVAVE